MPSGEARAGGRGEAWCTSPVNSLWDKLGFKTGLWTGLSEVMTGAGGLGGSDGDLHNWLLLREPGFQRPVGVHTWWPATSLPVHPILSLGASCSWATSGRSQSQRDAWDNTGQAWEWQPWAVLRDVDNLYCLFSSCIPQSCRVIKYDHCDGVGAEGVVNNTL